MFCPVVVCILVVAKLEPSLMLILLNGLILNLLSNIGLLNLVCACAKVIDLANFFCSGCNIDEEGHGEDCALSGFFFLEKAKYTLIAKLIFL